MTKINLLLLCLISIYACSSTPKSSKVGYAELTSSIRSGQRLQLVTHQKKRINIQVKGLSGDIITGTSLDKPKKAIRVNLNDIHKIRLYE